MNLPKFDELPGYSQPIFVDVIVEKRILEHHRWCQEEWAVIGVICGESAADVRLTKIVESSAGSEQYRWQGFSMQLFADDTESYYCNLMAEKPGW
ncbi:unnamed protein product, partial [marine sediment metagenome]